MLCHSFYPTLHVKITGPIILIDDDQDDHDIFKSICDNLGVCDQLKHFNNGGDVLAYLKTTAECPFVIICDINMPNLDGLGVKEIICKDPHLKNKAIPFVFFSTSSSNEQIKKAYELTVQGFFIKGNSFEETERKFRRILEYWSDC